MPFLCENLPMSMVRTYFLRKYAVVYHTYTPNNRSSVCYKFTHFNNTQKDKHFRSRGWFHHFSLIFRTYKHTHTQPKIAISNVAHVERESKKKKTLCKICVCMFLIFGRSTYLRYFRLNEKYFCWCSAAGIRLEAFFQQNFCVCVFPRIWVCLCLE